MKNKFIFFLLLTVTLAFFTSCDSNGGFQLPFSGGDDAKNKTAIEIYEAAEAKMKKLDSYTVTGGIDLGMSVYGKSIVIESDIVTKTQTTEDGKLLYWEETNTTSTYDETVSKQLFVEGFQDEYMYQYYSDDETSTELRSLISTENYKEYMKSKADDIDFGIDDFTKQEKKDVDNGWKLIFSELSPNKGIEYLNDTFAFSDVDLGVSVKDVTIIFTVNSDYYFTDMYMEFIFESDAESDEGAIVQQPKMIAEESYSGFNSTVVEKRNITNFNLVSDLRCIDKAADAFDKLLRSERIDFTIKAPNSINSAYTEIYDVNYLLSNGKPTYVMLIELKSATGVASEASITYSDGKKIVTSNGAASTQESDDLIEKATIRSLLLPIRFDAKRVRSITTDGEALVFEMKATKQETEQLLGGAAHGGSYECDFIISVLYDGDMIKEYSYNIVVRRITTTGVGIVLNVKYTVPELSYDAD